MLLDFLNALGFPFITKALALGGLADGAVALTSVLAIIGMSLTAVSFLRVDVAKRIRVAKRVLCCGDCNEMLRIHARSISARVVHHITFWNRTVGQVHRNAMRLTTGSPECEYAVAVSVGVGLPNHAVANSLPLRVETREFCFGSVAQNFLLTVSVGLMVNTLYGAP